MPIVEGKRLASHANPPRDLSCRILLIAGDWKLGALPLQQEIREVVTKLNLISYKNRACSGLEQALLSQQFAPVFSPSLPQNFLIIPVISGLSEIFQRF